MNVEIYQACLAAMLERHYGLSLGDTRFCDKDYVATLAAAGVRPFEVLNEQAVEDDLVRIDHSDGLGVASHRPLTSEDEERALASLP